MGISNVGAIALCIFMALAALAIGAEQPPEEGISETLDKYVSVTFEIHGLEESAEHLRDASKQHYENLDDKT